MRKIQTIASHSTPGRICLAGDSLDWIRSGSKIVLTQALDKYVVSGHMLPMANSPYLEVLVGEPYYVEVEAAALGFDFPEHIATRYPVAALRAMKDRYDLDFSGVRMRIHASLHPGIGLSSSAAVLVTVVQLTNDAFHLQMTLNEICETAYLIEHDCLGTGCGRMDPYACAYGGLLAINCSDAPATRVNRLPAPGDLALIVGDLGAPRNLAGELGRLAQREAQRDPKLAKYASRMSEIVSSLLEEFSSGNAPQASLGRWIDAAHAAITDYLDPPSEPLEMLLAAARGAGALGAKKSGIGTSGAMFALVQTEKLAKVIEAIRACGAKIRVVAYM